MLRLVIPVLAVLLSAGANATTQGTTDPAATSPPSATNGSALVSASSDPLHPQRSCKVDTDCQVKDVGNCCGTYRTCVNKDAATDPKAVRAQCQKEHRMGMCHVMAVGGCSCVQGQCSDINAAQMPGKP